MVGDRAHRDDREPQRARDPGDVRGCSEALNASIADADLVLGARGDRADVARLADPRARRARRRRPALAVVLILVVGDVRCRGAVVAPAAQPAEQRAPRSDAESAAVVRGHGSFANPALVDRALVHSSQTAAMRCPVEVRVRVLPAQQRPAAHVTGSRRIRGRRPNVLSRHVGRELADTPRPSATLHAHHPGNWQILAAHVSRCERGLLYCCCGRGSCASMRTAGAEGGVWLPSGVPSRHRPAQPHHMGCAVRGRQRGATPRPQIDPRPSQPRP